MEEEVKKATIEALCKTYGLIPASQLLTNQRKGEIDMETLPQMRSIKDTSLVFGLSQHALRQLCVRNQVPHIKSGKKILINITALAAILSSVERTSKINVEVTNE